MRRGPVVRQPNGGRAYSMPAMRAVFHADAAETDNAYSVSEWWLDPMSEGPGAHAHEANDEVFRVIAGTMSMLVADEWIDAPAGSVIVIPAGVTHDFSNRTNSPAGLFNISIPGGFEKNMPAILEWYEQNSGVQSNSRKSA